MRTALAMVFCVSAALLLVLILVANRASRAGVPASEFPRALVVFSRILAALGAGSALGWLILYSSGL